MRIVVWFSCGACSTVALERALKKYTNIIIPVYCDVGRDEYSGEHIDNERYLADVEKMFGVEILRLKSEKYTSPHDVYLKTKWINGNKGARCTVELKKVLRFQFEKPDDIQIFGYASDEQDRQKVFTERFPEVITDYILNEQGLTKSRCKGLIKKWGLELPSMYKLGYHNNNCVGCVKGGKGYWNKIRIDFPDTFKRMAEIERTVGASCIKGTYLDRLNPGEGRYKDEKIVCDFVCESIKTNK